jgi:3-phenylpropionate/trans-cinnamate dioxygenase ferredoxin subunit
MNTVVQVGKTNDLIPGQMKRVVVQGHEVLLARVGDQLYAVGNRCPHMGGNLSRGTLESAVITCPLHGSQFDVTDGRVIRWTNWSGIVAKIGKAFRSPRPLKTYKVQIENDTVSVVVES